MRRRKDAEHAVGVLHVARGLEAMVPGIYRRLGGIAVLSFGRGMLEAAVLVQIARIAVAVTEDTSQLELLPWVGVSVTIPLVILSLVGLLAAKVVVALVLARATASMAKHALTEVRLQLLRSFMAASWPIQSSERQGHLQELMTTHANRTTNVTMGLSGFITAGLSVIMMVAIAVVAEPVAAIGIVVGGAVLSLILRPFAAIVRRNAKRTEDAGVRFAGAVSQVVNTSRELHAFGTGPQAMADLATLQDHQARRWARSRFFMLLGPQIYQAVAMAMLIGGLGLVSLASPSNLAALGAVVLLLLRALAYGQQTQSAYQTLNDSVPFLDQLRNKRDLYMANRVHDGKTQLARIGSMELDEVCYEYIPGRPVLRGVSAVIEPGQAVGIIGPSGSGKSTLLQILLRLREPTEGRLVVDGRDARQLELAGWHGRAAFVPQDPRLIEGSVTQNIAFYRDIPNHSVQRAAEMANLADEISLLPRGYEEIIGPEDTTLSGGQQQRLTIARALAGEPDLLVLDEPTSALDMRSEARIQETLQALHGSMTLIIVAHRMSTVAQCDRVMVLTHGVVQAFDEHDALLSRSGFYEETLRLSLMQPAPAEPAR